MIWAYRCPECDGIIQEKFEDEQKFFQCAKNEEHRYESDKNLKKDYLWGLEYECPVCGAIERLGV
jgi:ssDNA-binding Zn-finger/Zn-ribbon topoisomerase 1